jgi:hypothetical protein
VKQGSHNSNLVGNHNVRDTPSAFLALNVVQVFKLESFQTSRRNAYLGGNKHSTHETYVTVLHQTSNLYPNTKREDHIILSLTRFCDVVLCS